MKLLVTGAGGMLARAFLSSVPAHHDVHAFAHGELDVGDYHGVMQTVGALAPDAIVNLAAAARVDACESEPELAYSANTIGARNVALAARSVGAIVLHISTDYVFDGEKDGAYDELDGPNPLSVYARSKLGGERLLREIHPEHFVVRTAYLFGGGGPTDRLKGWLDRLRAGEVVGAIDDRTGSPTYVAHLAERLVPLLLSGRFGTYHVAGPEPASWFDLVSRAAAMAGTAAQPERQAAASLGLRAPRPRNSALTSLFLAEAGVAPLPPLDVALKEALDGG